MANYRVRVGREIGSAALVADGRHSHAHALTSITVLLRAAVVRLGYPMADPQHASGVLAHGVPSPNHAGLPGHSHFPFLEATFRRVW